MLRSLITTEGRNARTRNERRRAGAKARRADKPHYGDFERAAGNHGRYSPPPRPFLRHERGILAEPSKPLRASPSPAEGRESYRPPSDPQGIGTRPRMMAFRSIDRLPKHRADGKKDASISRKIHYHIFMFCCVSSEISIHIRRE